MTIRYALLYAPRGSLRHNLEPILCEMLAPTPIALLEAASDAPLRAFRQLTAARPQIVIADAAVPHTLGAVLYRTLQPQSRLLLCVSNLMRPRSWSSRLWLSRADGVLTDPSDIRRVVERMRAQYPRPTLSPALSDLGLFRIHPPSRAANEAYRLLYVGDLSAASFAADVLIALAAWVEKHPYRNVEIWWAGDGDLSGVLAAQPLPPNLAQRFHGTVTRPELAQLMAHCGVLVAASDKTNDPAPLVEALAAGLVLVANRRNTAARLLLQPAGPGWLFDPAQPDGLVEALQLPLSCDPAHLDALRERGQRLARGIETTAAQDAARSVMADALAPSELVGSGALT